MTVVFSIPSFIVLSVLFMIYLLVVFYLGIYKRKPWSFPHYTLLTTFVIYLLGVIYVTLLPIDVNIGKYTAQNPWYNSINIIPLLTADARSFLLNVILTLPLGMLLPLLSPSFNSVRNIARQSFKLSIAIELIQLLISVALGSVRSTDINDLLANTLGGVLGYLLFSQIIRVVPIKQLLGKVAIPATLKEGV